jgi:hypothetical protein
LSRSINNLAGRNERKSFAHLTCKQAGAKGSGTSTGVAVQPAPESAHNVLFLYGQVFRGDPFPVVAVLSDLRLVSVFAFFF